MLGTSRSTRGSTSRLDGPLVGLLAGPSAQGPLVVLCFNGTSLVYLAQSWFHRGT
jgi:hypothetical protein